MHSPSPKKDTAVIVGRALAGVFFVALLLHLALPIFSPDFWWHLASGRWMWEQRSLMQSDPFGIIQPSSATVAESGFALKEYWLSQVVMYLVYLASGFKGLVVLRAVVLTLMLYVLYRLMRMGGAGRAISLLLIYVTTTIMVSELRYFEVRPQMWTTMMSVLALYLLERIRRKNKGYLALPPLMVLWSNLHGGFVLGDLIIGVYAFFALVAKVRDRRFYISCGAAILLSGLNPNGFTAFWFVLTVTFLDAANVRYWEAIVESQSIFSHSPSLSGIARTLPFLTGLLFVSLASLAINARRLLRMRQETSLLYALFCYMGVKSIRYIVFFAPLASYIAAVNLSEASRRLTLMHRPWVKRALSALGIVVMLLTSADLAYKGSKSTAFRYEKPYQDDYRGVVGFMKNNGLRGRIFNDYSAGGYLAWWLWPDVKVFIYGRVLSMDGFNLFRQVSSDPMSPDPKGGGMPVYASTFIGMDIATVVMPGCDMVSGVTIPLSYVLLNDDAWAVVYADPAAIVFMKKIAQNIDFIRGHELPRSAGYRNILTIASRAIGKGHAGGMPEIRLSMAIGHMGLGNKQEALRWVNEYLRMRPGSRDGLSIKSRIEGM